MADASIIFRDRPRALHSFLVLLGTLRPAFAAVLGLGGRRLWRSLGPRRRDSRSGISLWIVVGLREKRLVFGIDVLASGAVSVTSAELRMMMPSGAPVTVPASELPYSACTLLLATA
jgi:hypothetical protein